MIKILRFLFVRYKLIKISFCHLILSVFFTSANAEKIDENKTLCEPNEDIYFNCGVDDGKKIISVCARQNLSPTKGYVQYRYGTREGLELIYPKNKQAPKGKFFITNASEGSAVQTNLKFSIGEYTYVIYQSFWSGIYILKGNVPILRKSCTIGFGYGEYASISSEAHKGIPLKPKSSEDFH